MSLSLVHSPCRVTVVSDRTGVANLVTGAVQLVSAAYVSRWIFKNYS